MTASACGRVGQAGPYPAADLPASFCCDWVGYFDGRCSPTP